jgi:hypothetical protein
MLPRKLEFLNSADLATITQHLETITLSDVNTTGNRVIIFCMSSREDEKNHWEGGVEREREREREEEGREGKRGREREIGETYSKSFSCKSL